MPTETCSIPEVDRALSNYIHSRESTIRIRQTLAKYLSSNLRPVDSTTQNQHLTQECPFTCSVATTNPPGIEGARKAYLNAIRAKVQAQARLRSLQSSLEELNHGHMTESLAQIDSQYDNEVARGYLALLCQRRRFSELQVIHTSLEKFLNFNPFGGSSKDPKTLVKDAVGEQPNLPAERLEQISRPQDDGAWTFKLKQEVLEARVKMDRARSAKTEAHQNSNEAPRLDEQVYALGCARGEIVEWIQNELAKMEEESQLLEDASPIKRPMTETVLIDPTSTETQIQSSYAQYTTSRAGLIEAHKSFQQSPVANGFDSDRLDIDAPKTDDSLGNSVSVWPIVNMLPLLHVCNQVVRNDRSLLQQAVHLQGRISSADEESTESLLRLSGESHLLPARSKDVKIWTKTAKDVEETTAEFIGQHLQESRQEVSSVANMVELCSMQSKVLSST